MSHIPKEIHEELRASIEKQNLLYSDVQIQAAIGRGEHKRHKWLNALTKVMPLLKESQRGISSSPQYGDFVLIKEFISLDILLQRVDHVIATGDFPLGDYHFSVTQTQSHSSKHLYSHNVLSHWPCHVIEIDCPKPNIPTKPLVSYSDNFFLDGYHAIKHWLEFPKFHGDADARLGKLLLVFPDYRAKIKGVDIQKDFCVVRADVRTKIKGLQCKGIFQASDGREYQASKDFKQSSVRFSLAFDPLDFHFFLITPDNEVLDCWSSGSLKEYGNAVTNPAIK